MALTFYVKTYLIQEILRDIYIFNIKASNSIIVFKLQNGLKSHSMPVLINIYRVFHKKRSNVWHKIKPLPRGLENPSWAFLNSPFHVHFKNIQVCIIW